MRETDRDSTSNRDLKPEFTRSSQPHITARVCPVHSARSLNVDLEPSRVGQVDCMPPSGPYIFTSEIYMFTSPISIPLF